jgi:hypothetical protein
MLSKVTSVADPDHFGKLYPDPFAKNIKVLNFHFVFLNGMAQAKGYHDAASLCRIAKISNCLTDKCMAAGTKINIRI